MKDNRQVQRTLAELRSIGYSVDVVERIVPKTFIRKDYLGFIDLIAVGHGEVLGIQVCAPNQISAHKTKIRKQIVREDVERWLDAAKLELWSWEPYARVPTRTKFTLADLEERAA